MHLLTHRAGAPALLALILAALILLSGNTGAAPVLAQATTTPPPPTATPPPVARLPMIVKSASFETALLTGRVVDATTNAAIAGARVCRTGDALCITSDAQGGYSLPVPLGSTNVRISASAHYTLTTRVDIAAGQTVTRVMALSAPLLADQWRFVLTWDDDPPDLDAFLWLPDGSAVFWGARGDCDPNPPSPAVGACLEQDSRSGYGPESMTITDLRGGGYYTLGVHRYDDPSDAITEPSITAANARLHVYDASGQRLEFRIPAEGEGQFWYALDLDSTGLLTPYNVVSDHNPYAGLSGTLSLQQHGLPIK